MKITITENELKDIIEHAIVLPSCLSFDTLDVAIMHVEGGFHLNVDATKEPVSEPTPPKVEEVKSPEAQPSDTAPEPAPQPKKRKRRTKAQIEADEAAKRAAQEQPKVDVVPTEEEVVVPVKTQKELLEEVAAMDVDDEDDSEVVIPEHFAPTPVVDTPAPTGDDDDDGYDW